MVQFAEGKGVAEAWLSLGSCHGRLGTKTNLPPKTIRKRKKMNFKILF